MGQFTLDKPVSDPIGVKYKFLDDIKPTLDPSINIKKIVDDHRYLPRWDPYGPIKYDAMEGLLPFILATPHQYTANLPAEEQNKASVQMLDTMIQQAQYQIDMLNAHVEFLTKQRDKLKEYTEQK